MEPPYLKLVILQGPREGETLGFRPGTKVRIGRLVRGNTLPIKDAGISSKHLSIQIESSKWVIQDLDSSNGTIFNGSKIPPNTPFDLHHGDTIKIGEFTSIRVDLEAHEGSLLRRNPRRRATEKETDGCHNMGSVAGGDDQGPKGGELKEDEKLKGENHEALLESARNKRRGRPRKDRALKSEVGEELSKLQRIGENIIVGNESGNVVCLREKVEPSAITRVARNSKKQNANGTSSSTLVNSPDSCSLKYGEEKIVEKKTRVGTRRRKIQEETSLCDQVAGLEDKGNVEQQSLDAYDAVMVQETRDSVADLNPGVKEGFDKEYSRKIGIFKDTCSKREGETGSTQKQNLNENGDWPDLKKLTLGEWFDFLEVHLPKQITEETEEMIDSMKQKAERVRNYMVEKKNEKGKFSVG